MLLSFFVCYVRSVLLLSAASTASPHLNWMSEVLKWACLIQSSSCVTFQIEMIESTTRSHSASFCLSIVLWFFFIWIKVLFVAGVLFYNKTFLIWNIIDTTKKFYFQNVKRPLIASCSSRTFRYLLDIGSVTPWYLRIYFKNFFVAELVWLSAY